MDFVILKDTWNIRDETWIKTKIGVKFRDNYCNLMNAFVSTAYNKKFLHIRISIEFILIYLFFFKEDKL